MNICDAMETTPSAAAVMESQVDGLTEMVEVVAQGGSTVADFELLLLVGRFGGAARGAVCGVWGCFMWLGQIMSGLVGIYALRCY